MDSDTDELAETGWLDGMVESINSRGIEDAPLGLMTISLTRELIDPA